MKAISVRAGSIAALSLILMVAAAMGLVPSKPEAATDANLKAHGVVARCGEGADRTTFYFLYLSLPRPGHFDGADELLEYARQILPRDLTLRAPGQGAHRVRQLGASLPDFLFLAMRETRKAPPPGERPRAALRWRDATGNERDRLRLHRLPGDFCDRAGKNDERSATAQRSPATARGGAPSVRPGEYRGTAADGTVLRFLLEPDGAVREIRATASSGNLTYEVEFPETRLRRPLNCEFTSSRPRQETQFGHSPAEELFGGCNPGADQFKVTLRDRAGERNFLVERIPPPTAVTGRYEGEIYIPGWQQHSQGTLSFEITPDGRARNMTVREHNPRGRDIRIWRHAVNLRDDCHFSFPGTIRLPSGTRVEFDANGSCQPGGGISGELLSRDRSRWGQLSDRVWSASRVGD